MMEMIVTFAGGKRVNVEFSGFVVKTDQSRLSGGEGSAPEPFSLFLASIGACAGVYALGFCRSRDIPTEGIRLIQRNIRSKEGRIEEVEIEIELPSEFPEKYRGAIIRAAEQCAVKKAIENPPKFSVRTAVKS
ncbi:MAG: OsmC family protein [Myxococcota bacterium]